MGKKGWKAKPWRGTARKLLKGKHPFPTAFSKITYSLFAFITQHSTSYPTKRAGVGLKLLSWTKTNCHEVLYQDLVHTIRLMTSSFKAVKHPPPSTGKAGKPDWSRAVTGAKLSVCHWGSVWHPVTHYTPASCHHPPTHQALPAVPLGSQHLEGCLHSSKAQLNL